MSEAHENEEFGTESDHLRQYFLCDSTSGGEFIKNNKFLPIKLIQPDIPLPELWLPYLKESYELNIFTNQGPINRQFEKELERKFHQIHPLVKKRIMSVNNCTSGLMAGLSLLSSPGKVVTVSFSFAATAQAIVLSGSTPLFCDIDVSTLSMCVVSLEKILKNEKSIRAIVPVRPFGFDVDFSPIEKLAKQYDIPLIIDSAPAFFHSRFQHIGLQGDIEVLSFHATKLMGIGEGGAIICNQGVYDKLLSTCNFGLENSLIERVGGNYKQSDFLAAVGLAQLQRVDAFIDTRCKNASQLFECFSKQWWIERCFHSDFASWPFYPVVLRDEMILEKFKTHLEKNNIGTRRYYFPCIHESPFFKHAPYPLPVSESVSRRILCIPCHQQLTEDEMGYLLQHIISFGKELNG